MRHHIIVFDQHRKLAIDAGHFARTGGAEENPTRAFGDLYQWFDIERVSQRDHVDRNAVHIGAVDD